MKILIIGRNNVITCMNIFEWNKRRPDLARSPFLPVAGCERFVIAAIEVGGSPKIKNEGERNGAHLAERKIGECRERRDVMAGGSE